MIQDELIELTLKEERLKYYGIINNHITYASPKGYYTGNHPVWVSTNYELEDYWNNL